MSGPDLDPNCLTLMVFLKELFVKVYFERNRQTTQKHAKLPSQQRANRIKIREKCMARVK